MTKKKVVLTFPPESVTQPITYHLVKDYDLITNILRAEIHEEETGLMVLELDGDEKAIESGLDYLRAQKVKVQEAARDIDLDRDLCVDCGACTALCPTKALILDGQSWLLQFNKDECILCELCAKSCPAKAITISF